MAGSLLDRVRYAVVSIGAFMVPVFARAERRGAADLAREYVLAARMAGRATSITLARIPNIASQIIPAAIRLRLAF